MKTDRILITTDYGRLSAINQNKSKDILTIIGRSGYIFTKPFYLVMGNLNLACAIGSTTSTLVLSSFSLNTRPVVFVFDGSLLIDCHLYFLSDWSPRISSSGFALVVKC
jgi:hypothetical protein